MSRTSPDSQCPLQSDLDSLVIASQRYGWAVARGNQESADRFLNVVRAIKARLSSHVSTSVNGAYATGLADASH